MYLTSAAKHHKTLTEDTSMLALNSLKIMGAMSFLKLSQGQSFLWKGSWLLHTIEAFGLMLPHLQTSFLNMWAEQVSHLIRGNTVTKAHIGDNTEIL